MSKERVDLVVNVTYVVLLAGYVGFLVYMAAPGARAQLQRGFQWARYYRWRARWEAAPGWLQEALVVRGRGPA